jgi:2-polyprenyl-6-methoxyphenol hydroxylase-like FAD-dependent oxidoreductase
VATAGRRAIVIGGSMSGLMAAVALRQRGWDVDVYERVETELAGRGAGIVVQPTLLAHLRALGIDTAGIGCAATERKLFDAAGNLSLTRSCAQVYAAWERIHRLLRQAFDRAASPERYHAGRWLKRFGQDDTSVTALFNDGSKATADLLVGADGLRSTVRRLCDADAVLLYAGYVAWRGFLRDQQVPPDLRRDLAGSMCFCLPPGEQFLAYPVAGADDAPGRPDLRCNMVWYRPADEAEELRRLLTDRHGVVHAVSIPPPLLRPAAIDAMRADAMRLLCPQFGALMSLVAEPILQPIYDLQSRQMAFGRVAILGDAAFVARPHVAAGAAKAADDAMALAAALDGGSDIEASLRAFAAERLATNGRIVEQARHLGAYLQAGRTDEAAMGARRHGGLEAVLAETALLDFLQV